MSVGFPVVVQRFQGTQKELKEVINKFNPDVGIVNLSQTGPNAFRVVVNNTQQGRKMMNFNNFIFNGAQMIVTFEREPSTEAQLLHCFEIIKYSFCSIQIRQLDLSNLLEKFQRLGYIPQQPISQILTQCIGYFKEEIPDLLQLSLANNGIETGQIFSDLRFAFPQLSVLDISNNNIKNFYDIRPLQHLPIRVLMLANNPVFTPTIIPQLLIYMPTLDILNGQKVRQQLFISSNPTIKVLPHKFNSIFPTNPEAFKNVFQFMKNYYQLHDNDLRQLINLYDERSLFDIVMEKGVKLNNFQSRNLKNIHNTKDIIKGLSIGKNAIVETLFKLGGTQHRVSCFCFDIISFNQLVTITVMGDLKMGGDNDIYQFCRSFVMSISPRTVIYNDHLHLFPNTNSFSVIKTYSSYLKYVTSQFPGLNQEIVLFLLEKNEWNVQATHKEICQQLNIKSTF